MDENDSLRKELADLRARLWQIEKREAILDAIYRYHHSLGALKRDEWLDCFTPDGRFTSAISDGTVSFELRGHAELGRWYDLHAADWPSGSEGHAQVNPRILRMSESGAEVASFFITFQSKGNGLILRSYGDYIDRLSPGADGRWRIAEKMALTKMTNTSRA